VLKTSNLISSKFIFLIFDLNYCKRFISMYSDKSNVKVSINYIKFNFSLIFSKLKFYE